MRQLPRFQFLKFLGLEFWLPLPLIGLGFWLLSGWFASQQLNLPTANIRQLKIDQNERSPTQQILLIRAIVDRDRGTSQIKVKQATSIYQTQAFVLPTTDSKKIEAFLSQQLKLSNEQVRQLVRYQIKD
jgi:hypothetical protein